MKNKKFIGILCVFIVTVISFIYLYSNGTFTIFESLVEGFISPDIATWNIKVNDVVVTEDNPVIVDISDTTWKSEHVAENKVAPGSTGTLNIKIDPMDTDVAIRYELEIIDKNIVPEKLLAVTSITDELGELVKTNVNTYTGLISLNDINNSSIKNIKINVEWVYNGEEIDFDAVGNTPEDYIEINFRAIQYQGEEIVPYVS